MTSISKNVYINKLDYIVNKYNNTYHSSIKMKPVDVKSNTCINSGKKINLNLIRKTLHLKLVILFKHQNIETFLQKAVFHIGLEKFLLLQKLKDIV